MDNLNRKQAFLPPTWCSSICRNAMNEVCIEQCAVQRDCSGFEQKPNLKLIDMPRFPNTDDMSREEKFTSVAFYLSKVVEHLQGENVVPVCSPTPRSRRVMNSKRVGAVTQDEKVISEPTNKQRKSEGEDE